MDQAGIYQALHEFVSAELLNGDAKDLDEKTPLLEWGLIDSFSLVKLVGFIEKRFGIRLRPEALKPDTFKSLGVLTAFLCEQRPE
jgi:acyl carrier protein